MQLLKFYADWCGPCQQLGMTMAKMEFPYELVPVSLDENTDLAIKYGVRTIPTLILIDKEGNELERMQNSQATKDEIFETFVTKHV